MENRLPQLSYRMQLVADMVTKGNTACDIGCDHGYVAIYLCNKGIVKRCLACDVRKGPVLAAKKNVVLYEADDKIDIRLGDGLKVVSPGEADSVIIAGMGGRTIIGILAQSPDTVQSAKELIVEPQSDMREVRQYLYSIGFCIIDEAYVKEEGKYYPVIKAEKAPASSDISEEEYCFGPVLLKNKDKLLKEHLEQKKEWICGMKEALLKSKGERALNRLQELEHEELILNKGLDYYER